MSDRDVTITLKATDQVSKTFKTIGDAGKRMGDDLSRGADQAERDLKDLGETAKTTGRDFDQLKRDAQAVGLGIGAMIGTLAVAGQSFRDQEIALNTLRRSYGDAATGLEEFSRSLAENSNYSEEAIVGAANVAATLARNYGATAAEIQQILQISADLAATSGFTLEDASQRVVAALRGEAEAAEQLGLTMNQQAIDRNNLTLSMSNQEAFQFRLNALTEQSAFAMGAASEQADTAYGSMVDLEGTIRDTGQSIAASLGPLGEMGAYLADNATKSALFGASLVTMGRGVAGLTSLVGIGGLAGAIGPLGLVAAAGLAYAALDELDGNLESATEALERMDVAAADLDETVRQLFATGNQLAYLGEQGLEIFPGIEEDIANLSRLESQIAILQAQGGPQNDQQREMLQGWQNDLAALIQKYGELNSEQLESTVYATLFDDAQESFNAILAHTGVGAADAQASLAGLVDALEAGTITAPQFAELVNLVAAGLQGYDEAVVNATVATEEMAEATGELGVALGNTWQQMAGAATVEEGRIARLEALNDGLALAADALGFFDSELRENEVTGNSWLAMAEAGAITAVDFGEAMANQARAMEEAKAEVTAAADEYLRLHESIATTGEALDNAFRVVVTNTNAIADQTQGVEDWLTALSDTHDVWTELTIVQEANARVQQAVLDIQAAQAPVIAELTAAQADYVESIAELEGRQQLAALGFMDTTMAAQAMQLQMYALSGASDEAITSIITGAAAADPVLASMLEQMGLISIGADGTITVNVDGQSALDELSESIDRLTLVTWMIKTGVDAETARQQLIELLGLADDWGSTSATASLFVADNASGVIGNAAQQLRNFDGMSATAYVNVVQTGGVPRISGDSGKQHGGLLDGAQHGRMFGSATWVGEAGPELLIGGNHILPHTASMQTGGNTGGASVIVNIENLYGDETLAERVSAEIVPAVVRAMADHQRAYA